MNFSNQSLLLGAIYEMTLYGAKNYDLEALGLHDAPFSVHKQLPNLFDKNTNVVCFFLIWINGKRSGKIDGGFFGFF